jgi:hypothetical protein
MTHTRVRFREPDAALVHARPSVRFDVLERQTAIATGEVVQQ